MSRWRYTCAHILAGITIACAYPAFRDEIPNGLRAGDYNSEVIPAIGHVSPSGGGDLNAFGRAFISSGLEWTTALCQVAAYF